uniref:uncharacterized protein LOC114587428 n=1 Tax=Podarcis muralis TaxID=64176 RepID=UPI00109F6404|nr:uncharacterized protein LOC114587428 [Podarcis muralis]
MCVLGLSDWNLPFPGVEVTLAFSLFHQESIGQLLLCLAGYKGLCCTCIAATVKMVTPSLALLFLGIIAAKNDAIIMERCKLAAILRDEGMEGFAGTRIEEWICLVSHTSGFNTSALNVGPTASNYGIFLLSGRWWCRDAKTLDTRNHCNLSCGALQDDNITDDIDCAKRVVQGKKGFKAWRAWGKYCKGQEMKQYIAHCHLEKITPMTLVPATKLHPKPTTPPMKKDQITPMTLVPATKLHPKPTTPPMKKDQITPMTLVPATKLPPKPTTPPMKKDQITPMTLVPATKLPPKPTTPPMKKDQITPMTLVPATKLPPKPTTPPMKKDQITPMTLVPATKLPPKPTNTSLKEDRPKTTLQAKGPPKPTVPVKEPTKAMIPVKAPPKPTISIKEPARSTLPENGLPKFTASLKETPNSIIPANGRPKLTVPVKESSISTLPADVRPSHILNQDDK